MLQGWSSSEQHDLFWSPGGVGKIPTVCGLWRWVNDLNRSGTNASELLRELLHCFDAWLIVIGPEQHLTAL